MFIKSYEFWQLSRQVALRFADRVLKKRISQPPVWIANRCGPLLNGVHMKSPSIEYFTSAFLLDQVGWPNSFLDWKERRQ
jgi:hypothetical protein